MAPVSCSDLTGGMREEVGKEPRGSPAAGLECWVEGWEKPFPPPSFHTGWR